MRLFAQNWLYETKRQETERRIKALEASLQSAHSRINDLYIIVNDHNVKLNDHGWPEDFPFGRGSTEVGG